MLARANRVTSGSDFADAIRTGRRAGRATVVLHYVAGARAGSSLEGPRVGMVVGRGVGNAVTRNQVKRRLRHIARARLDRLDPGSVLVVRALPAAAGAPSGTLIHDFDSALRRLGAGTS
jgi:ribonuclease P protein component